MAKTNLATFGRLDRDNDAILSVAGTKADVFDALRKDGVGVAIWHRDFDSALSDWLDTVSPNDLPNGRILAAIADVPDAVESLVQMGNLQTGPYARPSRPTSSCSHNGLRSSVARIALI